MKALVAVAIVLGLAGTVLGLVAVLRGSDGYETLTLELQGGKKGLLQNSTDLCKTTNKAVLKMRGQNGKELEANPVVMNDCKKKQSRHHKKKR